MCKELGSGCARPASRSPTFILFEIICNTLLDVCHALNYQSYSSQALCSLFRLCMRMRLRRALAREVAPTTDVYLLCYPMDSINVYHWKLLFRSEGEYKGLQYGMFGVRVINELKFSPKGRPKDASPESA